MIETTYLVKDVELAKDRYKLHQMLCDGKVQESDDERVLFTLASSAHKGWMLKTATRDKPLELPGLELIDSHPRPQVFMPGDVMFVVSASFRGRVAEKKSDGSIFFRDTNLKGAEATERFKSCLEAAGLDIISMTVANEARITVPFKQVKRSFLPHTFAVHAHVNDVAAFNQLLRRGIGRGRAFGLGMIVLLSH